MPSQETRDESVTNGPGQLTQVRIDLGSQTTIIVILLLIVLGGCGVVIGIDVSERTANEREMSKVEQEARMQQYYLLELDAKFISASIKKPEDSIARKLSKGETK